MPTYPNAIVQLLELLRNLPGVGKKTAERYAFSMLEWDEETRNALSKQLETLSSEVSACSECGSYMTKETCAYCTSSVRDEKSLLIVAHPKEIYALEELGGFRGRFHVLGGLLSPLDGIQPEHLSIGKLCERVEQDQVEEIILALDTTIEGDATSLYIKELFDNTSVTISRLAHGMPIGSSLEYIDEHTLLQAFAGRRGF